MFHAQSHSKENKANAAYGQPPQEAMIDCEAASDSEKDMILESKSKPSSRYSLYVDHVHFRTIGQIDCLRR